jgi:hypothetical protein
MSVPPFGLYCSHKVPVMMGIDCNPLQPDKPNVNSDDVSVSNNAYSFMMNRSAIESHRAFVAPEEAEVHKTGQAYGGLAFQLSRNGDLVMHTTSRCALHSLRPSPITITSSC